MKFFRTKWERFIAQLSGNPARSRLSTGISRGLVGWLCAVVAVVAVSGLLVVGLKSWAAFVLGPLWGFVIGASLLIFFPAKSIVTLVGGLLGAGLTNLVGITGVADALDKQNAAVKRLATLVNSALPENTQITTAPVWSFLIIFFLTCLFAYREGQN
jgi:hypothetical protein